MRRRHHYDQKNSSGHCKLAKLKHPRLLPSQERCRAKPTDNDKTLGLITTCRQLLCMALVVPGNQQQCEFAINQPKEKRRPVLLVRVNTTDVARGKGDFERLALKIVDSAIQQSRPSTKSTSVSVPQGTRPSPILTGALRRVKQLPLIVLEVDVKFASL